MVLSIPNFEAIYHLKKQVINPSLKLYTLKYQVLIQRQKKLIFLPTSVLTHTHIKSYNQRALLKLHSPSKIITFFVFDLFFFLFLFFTITVKILRT